MCGINGMIAAANMPKQEIQDLLAKIDAMNDCIFHRGPNDDGLYVDERLAFGMRRLAIIDLSQGKQPIFNEDKSAVITFNGEIYNFKELRSDLEARGLQFATHSDTEVILKLYEVYGNQCVNYLDGMFAFSIHDKKKNKVLIARDRFGEKPLYYAKRGQSIVWGSELKSLTRLFPDLKQISIEALNVYLALTYIPAPLTIFKTVNKLEAGYWMEINTDTLELKTEKYWDIDINAAKSKETISYEEAKKHIRELLFKSVERRMIADVPLGVFLSGGVDSTIIAAIMSHISDKKIKTFSVGYANKRYDESARARQIAEHIGSEHHEYILNYEELLGSLDRIILNYDEPFADASCLPTYFISSKTVEHVTVALTGDGGDEVFGGYNKYLLHTYGKKYQDALPAFVRNGLVRPLIQSRFFRGKDSKSRLAKIRKMIESIQSDTLTNHLNIIALGFKQEGMEQVMDNKYILDYKKILNKYIAFPEEGNHDKIKLARYIDKQTSLEGDMLVKVDRASMLCSLECRAPLLDHKLMEYTYRLPDEYLLQGSNKKRILKDTFEDLLPQGFFNAPKSGFEIPIAYWLRNELKADLLATLGENNLNLHGYFNTKFIARLIEEHLQQNMDHSWQLWTIFCFQKWYNKEIAGL